MPNCDWGKECECLDCRTSYDHHDCPKCGFSNTVSIVREMRFSAPPQGPNKDLQCYKCDHVMKQVRYYTESSSFYNQRSMDREKLVAEGRACSKCNKVERIDVTYKGIVELKCYQDMLLCQECLIGAVKQDIPDPSTNEAKYVFDSRKMTWVLDKIKLECMVCGKKRWINPADQWKMLCLACYKETAKSCK